MFSIIYLQAFYDLGISRQHIFTGVAIACVFVIINCYINVHMDPIPDPEDDTFGRVKVSNPQFLAFTMESEM